jgi:hypothetical protein
MLTTLALSQLIPNEKTQTSRQITALASATAAFYSSPTDSVQQM